MEIPFPMEPSNNNLSLLLDLSNQSINYITQAFEILIIMPTSSLFDIRNISNIVINRINQGELKIDKNITRLLNQLFRNMNKYKQFEPKTYQIRISNAKNNLLNPDHFKNIIETLNDEHFYNI